MNKRANTIMEWVILIGLVSLGFITMNIYVKRGLQGKIADMSDYFIGEEHAADANPTAIVTSKTVSSSSGTTTSDMSFGGGMQLALLEDRDITATSRVVDESKEQKPGKFVPQESGNIDVPVPPDPQQIAAEADQTEEVVDFKTQSKENQVKIRLKEAAQLEKKADELDANAAKLRQQADDIDCPRYRSGSCKSGKKKMRLEANEMVAEAKEMRKEAEAKRTEAAQIQAEIDQLKGDQ
ncbi:MAG: hypothetical protein PHG40_00620 [Candidatus Omnitrophica bacterium]|nr:hypothetical protein [Candidatus Omnitrophota bacterium]